MMENNGFMQFPTWKHAVKVLLDEGLTHGSHVTRARMAELCQIDKPHSVDDVRRYDLELLQCITEIRDTLLTAHCMLLVADNNGGFHVLPPEAQTAHAIKTGMRAVAKEFRRMSAGISFVKSDALDDAQRARNADAQAKLSMMASMIKPHKEDLQRLALD